MKAGWTTRSLGEICQIKLGKTPARAVPSYWDSKRLSGHVWLSIADLQYAEGKLVHDSSEYLSDSGAELCTPVSAGTLLLSFKLTLGRLAFAGRDLFTNEAIAALPIVADQEISKEYLYWYLAAFDWESASAGEEKIKGVTLNKAKLAELPIHFPKLPEQRRIVALLDEAFAGLATAAANAERNLDNARELFESHLAEVFSRRGDGWVETTLGECTRFIDYRGKTPIKTKSGLRLITAKNVKMGYLQRAPEEFVAPDSYSKWMTRGIPERGDVIFTTEAPLANVALLDTDERVVFAQRIIVLQPDRAKLGGAYLKYMLQSAPLQASIHAHGTGATVQGIKASLLKNIPVCFPAGLGVQASAVRLLDALSAESQRLGQNYIQKQAALAALKRSLLHQAFSGNL